MAKRRGLTIALAAILILYLFAQTSFGSVPVWKSKQQETILLCSGEKSNSCSGLDERIIAHPGVATHVKITHPTLSIPVITQQGDTIIVTVETDANETSLWKANLTCRYDTTPLTITGTPQKTSPGNWTLNVTIPSGTRPDLYSLAIIADGVSAIQSNAVLVSDTIKQSFQFVHVTDVHIGALSTGSAYNNFLTFAREMEIIRPSFIVMTGDDCDKYLSSQEFPPNMQDEKLVEALKNLRVPIYVGSGNHDYSYVNSSDPTQNIERYRSVVNDRLEFSFEYGTSHFAFVNSGKYSPIDSSTGLGIFNETLDWLDADLKNHTSSTSKFILHHHPVFPDWLTQNEDAYRQLLQKNNVSMVLSGHTHSDDVYDRNGTRQLGNCSISASEPLYVTTQGMKYYHGYRIVRVTSGKVSSYTYDKDANGLRDAAGSVPLGLINVTYSPSNNGTAMMVRGQVVNYLREDFNDIFFEFKMPKVPPGGSLSVKGGYIWQKIPLALMDIYYVHANVSKLDITNVTLEITMPTPDNSVFSLMVVAGSAAIILAIPCKRKE